MVGLRAKLSNSSPCVSADALRKNQLRLNIPRQQQKVDTAPTRIRSHQFTRGRDENNG